MPHLQLSAGFVEALTASCPELDWLLLDQCDLAGRGFALGQDPYGALQRVLVRLGECMLGVDVWWPRRGWEVGAWKQLPLRHTR